MSTLTITAEPQRKQSAPLVYFLGLVMVIFIGILIFCYVVTKQTNPVFLDQHGKPVSSQSAHTGH